MVDLNIWKAQTNICQRVWGRIYTHALILTHLQMHTDRYCLNVIATVCHHAHTGGSAQNSFPQGWQAGDSTHSEAVAGDHLQKLYWLELSVPYQIIFGGNLMVVCTKCNILKQENLVHVLHFMCCSVQATKVRKRCFCLLQIVVDS